MAHCILRKIKTCRKTFQPKKKKKKAVHQSCPNMSTNMSTMWQWVMSQKNAVYKDDTSNNKCKNNYTMIQYNIKKQIQTDSNTSLFNVASQSKGHWSHQICSTPIQIHGKRFVLSDTALFCLSWLIYVSVGESPPDMQY